jgi:mevalonate kinase
MVVVSAPGKIILLGEHAVVFGKPAIALSIGLRSRCIVEPSSRFTINGHPLSMQSGQYVATAVQEHWRGGPLSFEIDSDLPSGSGLGSSAAVTVAALGAMQMLSGRCEEKDIAQQAFDVESRSGEGLPHRYSTSVHGRGIFLSYKKGPDLLWEVATGTPADGMSTTVWFPT